MRTAVELAQMINTNISCIINALTPKDIDAYLFLKSNFGLVDVANNEEYRRKFRGYYIMRYTAQDYVDRFFELFEHQKHAPMAFGDLSRELYKVDGKHQLSFISKLLHTTDDSLPIFDSQVGKAFDVRRNGGRIEERISADENLLLYMAEVYRQMEAQNLIADAIQAFDHKFPGNSISFVKKVDFLLWKMGETPVTGTTDSQEPDIKPGRYRHFKGREYEVLCIALHSETMEPMVIYRARYGERRVWVRPASMWNEEVHRDGMISNRFSYIGRDMPNAHQLGGD